MHCIFFIAKKNETRSFLFYFILLKKTFSYKYILKRKDLVREIRFSFLIFKHHFFITKMSQNLRHYRISRSIPRDRMGQ